ncbi:DUF4427 domain-containing protein [Nostoc sp. CMAA1605]|uniref:DUF4427 domain-containing protein n=1 Tax=Nostoc sp. CMAA1605 TaxID=2055159 RepID=UPI001F277171|nr:DUF4427 domain-containing protein [Nostoc sp. CMAA1605]MCF4965717.1 hypothetical protein [Nostoc sp. CMAA1605]
MKTLRTDLSNKLIHFVREIDLHKDSMGEMFPHEFNLNEGVEDTVISPFFLLRRILRQRQLLSTWSYRNGERTIYGSYPAVCFTEMPLKEFVISSIERCQRNEKISSYAIIFDKKQMFKIGARPVIYGTSCTSSTYWDEELKGRFLTNKPFSNDEMYRYVSFNLSREPRPIDWTHEREWRWPNYQYRYVDIDSLNPDEANDLYEQGETGRIDFHGLNIDNSMLSDIGFIVKNTYQSTKLLRDILWQIDSGQIRKNLFTYILHLNNIQESIDEIKTLHDVETYITKNTININDYYSIPETELREIEARINYLSEKVEKINFGNIDDGILESPGISFPCLRENFSKIARALVLLGKVKITRWGRYLIDIPCLNKYTSMTLNEKIAKEFSKRFQTEIGTECTYYSILCTNQTISELSIDDVPFYTESDDIEINYAHSEDDF